MSLLLAALLAVGACAQGGAAPTASQRTGQAQAAAAGVSKTLVLMTRSEPDTLAGTSLTPGVTSTGGRRRLFNAGLTLLDGDANPLPYLAESLPQLNTDTWRVLPDGQMETTYRLRPNLTWHDGAPLTADDFVFAYEVYATPELGRSGVEPINMIAGVDAPDPRTVLIHWRGAYTEAGALESVVSTGTPSSGPSFAPLPRHILERPYQEERDTFLTNPYWTTEFVGSGPYRLDRWEPGSSIEAAAFDGHALGRPKIDRVKLTWNADSSVVLANLLSGEAHLSVDDSIKISEGIVLQQDWSARGAGQVRFIPKNWRHLDFQLRPEYASPRATLDDRVRRALAHSIDKDAINEGLFQGVGLPAISMMYPSVPYHADIEKAAATYPPDPARVEALMQEAGYRRGADGSYEGPEGHLLFQIKGTSSPENASERTILAAGWRQDGFDTEEAAFSPAETKSGQTVSTFRSMYSTGAPAGLQAIGLFVSPNIPRPENRWVGSNRGGWSSPEYDRLAEAVQSTLEPSERAKRVVEAVKVFTEEIGSVSLYFSPSVITLPSAVRGMAVSVPEAEPTWNIYQWEIQ